MVRVAARALRDCDRDVIGTLLLERQRRAFQLRERLRDLHEPCVDDEADVLERNGRPEEAAAVRERVEGVGRELLLERLRREQRLDEAVGRQLAGPVVRPHDHVGRLIGADGAELVADVAERLLDDLHVDAARPRPGGRDLVDRCMPVLVCPDAERRRGRAVGPCRRGGDAEHRDGEDREHRGADA